MNPIIIDLPLPPDCLHPNARPNLWDKAKAVKATRSHARIIGKQFAPKEPMEHACYRLIFWLPKKRDYDGLISWVKNYIDGFQDAGIIKNDSDFRPMGIERFSGNKETGGKRGVRFVIWQEFRGED